MEAEKVVKADLVAPVLDDIKYVITVADIQGLIKEYKDLEPINPLSDDAQEQYNIVTTAYKSFKDARISVEKTRVDFKQPALDYGRKVDLVAKELQKMIEPFEESLKKNKLGYENYQKQLKREAEEAEEKRIADINKMIDEMRELPFRYVGASSSDTKEAITELGSMDISDELFEEFKDIGEVVRKESIDKLTDIFNTACKTENDKREAQEEATRREKALQEQNEREAEAKKKMEDEMAELRAEKKALQDKVDAEEKAKREAIEAKELAEKEAREVAFAKAEKERIEKLEKEREEADLRFQEESRKEREAKKLKDDKEHAEYVKQTDGETVSDILNILKKSPSNGNGAVEVFIAIKKGNIRHVKFEV